MYSNFARQSCSEWLICPITFLSRKDGAMSHVLFRLKGDKRIACVKQIISIKEKFFMM
jgi:hypothetical protein